MRFVEFLLEREVGFYVEIADECVDEVWLAGGYPELYSLSVYHAEE